MYYNLSITIPLDLEPSSIPLQFKRKDFLGYLNSENLQERIKKECENSKKNKNISVSYIAIMAVYQSYAVGLISFTSYASGDYIAKKSGLSISTVKKAIQALNDMGFIKTVNLSEIVRTSLGKTKTKTILIDFIKYRKSH